jgi:uncharacterized protein (DUF924 family)
MFNQLADDGAENGESNVGYAIRHRDIIARFAGCPIAIKFLGGKYG